MKKLLLLSIFAFFALVSANVFGQNAGTPLNPSMGDIRTYSVASHLGSTYSWTLQTTADGSGTDLFVAAAIASATGTSSSSVTVTWLAPVVPTIYYLHLTETNATCSNRKVLAIQPVNNFKLEIVNVDAVGTPLIAGLATNNPTCAPAIASTMIWNGTGSVTTTNATDFKYDYGTTTYYYKITATGINFSNTEWTPSITIAQLNGTNASVTIDTKVGTADWVTPSIILTSANGTFTPLIPAGVGNSEILVKVTVKNNIGTPATANENLSDNTYTITLNAASKDENNNPATSLGNGNTVQTQLARPASGFITY